jgi:hypothetical protein
MRIETQHELTTQWNLKRKHRVVIYDLQGNKLKTMWLNKDGSNKLTIEAEAERLHESMDRN